MTYKIQTSIDNQNKVINLLDSFGVTFQSKKLNPESENAFTKVNGGDSFVLYLTDDVDIDGVFEEERVEGILIERAISDNGYNSKKFPIIKISC